MLDLKHCYCVNSPGFRRCLEEQYDFKRDICSDSHPYVFFTEDTLYTGDCALIGSKYKKVRQSEITDYLKKVKKNKFLLMSWDKLAVANSEDARQLLSWCGFECNISPHYNVKSFYSWQYLLLGSDNSFCFMFNGIDERYREEIPLELLEDKLREEGRMPSESKNKYQKMTKLHNQYIVYTDEVLDFLQRNGLHWYNKFGPSVFKEVSFRCDYIGFPDDQNGFWQFNKDSLDCNPDRNGEEITFQQLKNIVLGDIVNNDLIQVEVKNEKELDYIKSMVRLMGYDYSNESGHANINEKKTSSCYMSIFNSSKKAILRLKDGEYTNQIQVKDLTMEMITPREIKFRDMTVKKSTEGFNLYNGPLQKGDSLFVSDKNIAFLRKLKKYGRVKLTVGCQSFNSDDFDKLYEIKQP